MKTYKIIKKSTFWSTNSLINKVEQILQSAIQENYEIVSVSFGVNLWWIPTAFITLSKEQDAK
ncbi:MAG: hypothetical protein ACK4NY_02395 [Spirosomataceae bacterium]